MQLRGFIPMAVVCVGIGPTFGTTASAVEQTGTAPLQLKKFIKTPVSSSATHTVKQADGDYAQLPGRRLRKKKLAQPPQQPKPAPTSIEISAEATSAYAAVMDAQVKVVPEDEVNELDVAADANPIIPVAVATRTERGPIAAANEIHAVDQAADKETVAIAPAPQPAVSAPIAIADEHKSWVQRMLDGLNIMVSAATTAVKALFA